MCVATFNRFWGVDCASERLLLIACVDGHAWMTCRRAKFPHNIKDSTSGTILPITSPACPNLQTVGRIPRIHATTPTKMVVSSDKCPNSETVSRKAENIRRKRDAIPFTSSSDVPGLSNSPSAFIKSSKYCCSPI